MGNTFTSLHYHLIYSTRHRERWIAHEIEQRIWAFLGGIAQKNGMVPLEIGGMPDHVHIVVAMPPVISVSDALRHLKGGSSKWIKDEFPRLQKFGWQDGYGAFSVSRSGLPEVIAYVQNQREHHRAKSFKEEYLVFLKRHRVDFDERYVFD